ncbi:MAG: hypothetical protein ICV53_21825, partial [Flavisolibacter sp.]|nr:hypothetical protein [Flavisolibacter sp.]
IVTGDIAEIHGSTNWITDRCHPSGINVFLPLWHIDIEQILLRLFSLGFKIIFSYVKPPWFRSEWLGKALDESVIVELMELNVEKGLDICGEQGEYHTWVLDGPLYKQRLSIKTFNVHRHESIMYLEMTKLKKEIKDPWLLVN